MKRSFESSVPKTAMRYLLQQPRSLEDLTMQAVVRWIIIQMKKIIRTITEIRARDATEANKLLSGHIKSIRYCLQCNVPKPYQDILAEETIKIYQKIRSSISKAEWRMMEVLFSKNLTRLSLDERELKNDIVNQLLPSITSNANMLTGLVEFNLIQSKYTNRKGSTLSDFIIPIIRELHNVKYISLDHFFCRREVLETLVENCKMIEKLQFIKNTSFCIGLLLEDVAPLIQLSKLRSIYCRGLNFLDKLTIEKLLLFCKHLEHVGIKEYLDTDYEFFEQDVVGEALKKIKLSGHYEGRQFNLKSYENVYTTKLEHMKLVTQMCPMIEEMILENYEMELSEEKEMIAMIPNLKRLKLKMFDFYSSGIREMLALKGFNVVELSLQDICQFDVNALQCISQNCPNLENLFLKGCFYVNDASSESVTLNKIDVLKTKPFENLKRLVFSSSHKDEENKKILYLLLSNSPKIKYITIVGLTFEDDLLKNILDKNPLKYLEKLILEPNCSNRPILHVDRIIENCGRPEIVQVLKNF